MTKEQIHRLILDHLLKHGYSMATAIHVANNLLNAIGNISVASGEMLYAHMNDVNVMIHALELYREKCTIPKLQEELT